MKYVRVVTFFFCVTFPSFSHAMLVEDLRQKQLYEAIEADNEERATALLKDGALPNESLMKHHALNPLYFNTPTYVAITHKKPAALAALLEHGGNPDAATRAFHSTFFDAIEPGNAVCLALLLKYKVDTKIAQKITTCKKAIETNDIAILQALVKYKYLKGEDVTPDVLPIQPEEISKKKAALLPKIKPEIEKLLLTLRKEWRDNQIEKARKHKRGQKRKCPEDERKEICPICQDDLSTEAINKELTFDCKHNRKFHMLCVQALEKKEKEKMFPQLLCPLCRSTSPSKKPLIVSLVSGAVVYGSESLHNSYDWASEL